MPDQDNNRFYRGRSMAGSFRAGDYVTVAPVNLADVRTGDVVVYRRPDHQGDADELVHRIVAAMPEGLVARGDDNPCADATLVTADDLLGRFTYIERYSPQPMVSCYVSIP